MHYKLSGINSQIHKHQYDRHIQIIWYPVSDTCMNVHGPPGMDGRIVAGKSQRVASEG